MVSTMQIAPARSICLLVFIRPRLHFQNPALITLRAREKQHLASWLVAHRKQLPDTRFGLLQLDPRSDLS